MTLLREFRTQIHETATQRAARRRPLLAPGFPALAARVLGRLPALLGAGVAVVVAGLALFTLHGGRPRTPTASPPAATAGAHRPQPVWLATLAQRFSVLHGRPTAPTADLTQTLVRLGVSADDLRFVYRVALPAGSVWIAPTASTLCVAFEPSSVPRVLGATCASVTEAEHMGVRLSVGSRIHLRQPPSPSNPLMSWHVGVVPDGITHVRVRTGTGAVASTVVRRNAFAVASPVRSRRGS